MNSGKVDPSHLSFEEALKNLESIVKILEEGSASLEEAITLYEQGTNLKKHCETKLKEATLKVERILVSADGSLTTLEEKNIT